MSKGFLDKVYDARSADETRDLYDDWAASYEAEVAEHGYVTPRRCAEALASASADLAAPILDFGCGTGLSGLAFRAAGFSAIDGVDLSPEMLEVARSKGIYRALSPIKAGAPVPAGYAAIAAVGVIGAGAAPISVLDTMLDALAPGGLLVLSFNDHALEDPQNEGRIDAHVSAGNVVLKSREYGDHLPGINLKSNVYVFEKA